MESQAALLTYLCILNVPLLLSQQLKELECPCSFFAQSNYKMVPVGNDEKPIPYTTCLTTVPTAAGENITELRGLNASCKRMKSSPAVIPYEVFDQIFKDKDIHSFPELADWPIQTVFLVDNSVPGTHFAVSSLALALKILKRALGVASCMFQRDDPYGCTFLYYVDDDLNLYNKDFPENDGWFDSCQALLEHKYFEMVLCETKPWVDQAANCSCPCGFALDHGGICVGGIPSCDPIINYTLISVLCYGVNNTVGYPARFYNNSPDANVSHLWPNDTVFFFGDPIHVVDDGSGQAQQPVW